MMTNKKTLKRQYLETKTRAGVYAIRNQITGRALVAGSTNVQGTLNRHRFELQHGQHRNARLYASRRNFLRFELRTPEAGKDTAANIKGAELRIVEGMGHDFPPSLFGFVAGVIADNTHRANQIL